MAEDGAATKAFGVTDAVSLEFPTPEEINLSEKLTEMINIHSPLESDTGLKHREQILRELQKIVQEWIYEVGVGSNGMDDQSAREAGGKIFTFGSYRLGVVGPNSDIDALCVAPRHISRESFFQMLAAKLQENPKVSEIQPVPDAYTPIIKMIYHGVDIDLLFARLNLSSITSLESLEDDSLLKNLDDKSVRCLNGCRVNDLILRLVPNRQTFKESLRFIKYWAKKRGLYSNVLGFFGGITWAILVARICQLYPNACTSVIVGRFFRIYEKWNWKNAVMLSNIIEHSNTPGLSQLKIWNPRTSTSDRHHLMPIITPAFPSMNSTHNVTNSTKKILLSEFKRANDMVEKMEKNDSGVSWVHLCEDTPFFTHFKNYIQVKVLAKSEMIFHKWLGWIESKLRLLVRNLESSCNVRPWPGSIEVEDDGDWSFSKCLFLGLKFSKSSHHNNGDLRQPVISFVEMINSWPNKEEYEGRCDMRVTHLRREDLPIQVNPEAAAQKEAVDQMEKSRKRELPVGLQPLPFGIAGQAHGSSRKKIKVSLKK